MSNTKKNKKIVQITLTEREFEILEYIQKQEGQGNIPIVIHSCIAEHFRRQYFDKRSKGSSMDVFSEKVLTLEQNCELHGGKVIESEGIKKCVFQVSAGMKRTIPLNAPHLFPKMQ